MIQIRQPLTAVDNVTLLEMVAIAKVVTRYRPRRLLEIGTFDGRTTLNLAANSGEGTEVFTLDLTRGGLGDARLPLAAGEQQFALKDVSGARFQGTDCEGKIRQLFGDSAAFDFSPYFGTVDFVFIDASHSYEYVLKDLRLALKLLREGDVPKVILWHDYGIWEGVTTALDEPARDDPRFGGLQHIEHTPLACLVVA